MAIVGCCSSSRRALNALMRGTVTDRLDRNRHVVRLNFDVTVARMNDLDALLTTSRNYCPTGSVSSIIGPVSRHAPRPTS